MEPIAMILLTDTRGAQSVLVRQCEDWDALIKFAAKEGVLPAIHPRISGLGLASYLPSEIADFFLGIAELNRERNAAILSQLQQIVIVLNSIGIEPVALKGVAYILSGIYEDPATRYLGDIDLLIPANQITTAFEILQTQGYLPDEKDVIASFRHHLPALFRPGNVPVELHHSVGLGVCPKLLSAAELIRDSSLVTWNGARLRIPSSDHLITHLVIHSQLVHPYVERIWPPLLALYDLALLQRRFSSSIDWLAIAQRFRSRRQHTTLALHLLHAQQSTGTPLPIPVFLDWFARLRWSRRQILRRFPKLRLVDPVFLFSSAVSRRARVLRRMLLSGAWKRALQRALQPSFYRRLASDLRPCELNK